MARLAAKVLLLGALVLPLQLMAGSLMEPQVFPARDRMQALVDAKAEILLFGDSVATFFHPSDADRRPLDRLLEERLAGATVGLAAGEARFMDVHLAYLEWAIGRGCRPRALILPVNLRSFSPLWDLHPGLQQRRDRLRLRWGDTWGMGLIRPLEGYRLLDRLPTTESEWLESPVHRGPRRVGTVREVLEGVGPAAGRPDLERFFTLCYMADLDPSHRHLKAFRRIAELCRRERIPLLPYVTPVDAESGVRAVGEDFLEQLRRNVRTVERALAGLDTPLLDLSATLPAEAFAWGPIPNEHLSERGRQALASMLASTVRR